MADFTEQSIEIRYYTDAWGPYQFSFPAKTSLTDEDGVLPVGATLATADVKAYLGNVSPSSDLTEETEVTADIIEPGSVSIIDDTNVQMKFQYPGDTYKGQKVTLVFELTTDGGAKYPFYFKYLKVK